jgi:hypothetical protein
MAIDGRANQQESAEGSLGTAPYLAKIVSLLDPQYQGGFEVTLIRNSGSEVADETQTYVVRYASPFYGTTAYEFMGKNNTFDDTQKSYGFWAMPPDVGVTGLVIFIEGNAAQGYWIACIPDKFANHMIPAIGGTKVYETAQDYEQGEHPLPVAEHNRKANELDKALEIDKIPRAVHPVAETFKRQGLIRDEFRGTSTSSGRRDIPNLVFGMSSPGPLDRNGKRSFTGVKQAQALIPVSRLGGTVFVMDDGDDRYFRDKPASEEPPIYTKGDGDKNIPYNEHFRIRTRTGHQILLHNSEDLIYIGNARGTAWIEISSDGKIDIFATDSISMRTKADFNFYADRDINFEAGRNVNTKVGGEMYTNVVNDNIVIVEGSQNTHIFGSDSLRIDGNQTVRIFEQLNHSVVGAYRQTVESLYDLNVKDSIKVTASKSLDIKAGSDGKLTFDTSLDIKVGTAGKLTTGAALDIKAGGHIRQTSTGANETNASRIIETAAQIHMNGPTAATAATAATAKDASTAFEPTPPKFLVEHELPDLAKPGAAEPVEPRVSILRRVPTPEPYPQHENLNPLLVNAANTDRDVEGRFATATVTASPAPTTVPDPRATGVAIPTSFTTTKAPPTASMAKPAEEWKLYKKPADNPF